MHDPSVPDHEGRAWWRGAAIYQLYVQSFADGSGDGVGDLAGVRERLPHLAALGVDAIWYSPWYPSPKSDAGYDVADYRSIDPAFGTLADADALIREAHAHGIRTIIDIVPNHCSDQHPWFQAALAATPGSAERSRFWFRPGRGPDGDLPPNNWRSIFGGPAWTRTAGPDGSPGEWYLHLFAPQQPDFNWGSPDVRGEFEGILRFWFDRGVDGVRIDSAALLTKDAGLPDMPSGGPSGGGRSGGGRSGGGRSGGGRSGGGRSGGGRSGGGPSGGGPSGGGPSGGGPSGGGPSGGGPSGGGPSGGGPSGGGPSGGGPGAGVHPFVDRDDVHDIYRSWRSVAESYDARVLIGEIWLPDAARFARYLRPDELHTVFNFPYLCCPWDAAELRSVIDATLELHAPVGAPATWVLSNHDVDRVVSRYGRADTSFGLDRRDHSQPVDLELGTRRARAAVLLTTALPGSVYVYQGEELGLWEVEDIPDELRQDPIFYRTGGADPGRDGSRVPLPWTGTEPPFGFSPPGALAQPWLPQPKEWRDLTVETETGDPDSMLELYRTALRIRRAEPALGDGPMAWLPTGDGVLAFDRAPYDAPAGDASGGDVSGASNGSGAPADVRCVTNLSPVPVDLPPHTAVLLASGPLDDGQLPPDTAAWLRPAPEAR